MTKRMLHLAQIKTSRSETYILFCRNFSVLGHAHRMRGSLWHLLFFWPGGYNCILTVAHEGAPISTCEHVAALTRRLALEYKNKRIHMTIISTHLT